MSEPTIGEPCFHTIKLRDSARTVDTFPPALGADTDDVLSDVLGLSPEGIDRLREAGVVGLSQGVAVGV